MIAVIQKVTSAKVTTEKGFLSEIKAGYCILVGIFKDDTEIDIKKIINKICSLRICADELGKMNKSLIDIKGEVLLVSQFTLCANLKDGRRPSFIKAMNPDEALKVFNKLRDGIKNNNISVKTGSFGNHMNVEIHNDGPVTIIIDSKEI
jgi:D-tyrosyl-tRNA(Tyr) deacylase